MNISQWPIGRILQLPDHCLSRRFSVFVTIQTVGDSTQWDISELALPDKTIIHEFAFWGAGTLGQYTDIRLALGDQLPTATTEMDTLDPLFHGLGVQGPEPRTLLTMVGVFIHFNRLKMYVPAQGRRLILETVTKAGTTPSVSVGIVVSSVPTEVPDWLISGPDKSQL